MSYTTLHILAQRDAGDWIGFVFAALVGMIVLISYAASQLNRKFEEERRRRVREQLSPGAASRSRGTSRRSLPPLAEAIAMRVPRPPPAPAKRTPQPARVRAGGQSRGTPPPLLPVHAGAADEPATHVTALPVTATEISATARAAAAATASRRSADAASVKRWLRPETLRQQFILTEVLQPPVALREPRE